MNYIIIEERALDMLRAKLNKLTQVVSRLNPEANTNKWIDSKDVCHVLGISARTLQYYRNQRVIPYTFIGSKTYYEADKIVSLLQAGLKHK